MNIPNLVYVIAMVLSLISIAIEIISSIVSIFYMFEVSYDSAISPLNDIFKSGIKVRNASFCLLVLLFFIANKKTVLNGKNVFLSISKISKIFAIGSLVVFAIGIIISILIAVKKIKSEQAKKYSNMICRSSFISILFGFCISNFFYIP